MLKFAAALVFCCVSLSARAVDLPTMGGPVNDNANIFDEDLANQVSRALISVYEKGGPQLAVLTVPSLNDRSIEDVGIDVARAWKLGHERKDNGILLLIAPKERQVRIEVGGGVEGDLTDALSSRIIRQIIIPEFRGGHYTEGMIRGVDAILRHMDPPVNLQDYIQMPERPQRETNVDWVHILIFFAIVILLIASRGGRGGGNGLFWFLLGNSLGSSGRGGWGGGGGFGGGGGGSWSGGGGGFSGGGASGSW